MSTSTRATTEDTLYTVTQFDNAVTSFRHSTCTTSTAYIHAITSRKPHCSHFVPQEKRTHWLSNRRTQQHKPQQGGISGAPSISYHLIQTSTYWVSQTAVVRSTNMATENSKPMVPNMVARLAPEFGWSDSKIKVRELVDVSTPYTTCHLRDFRLLPRCKWCFRLVVIYRGFGTTCRSNLQESSSLRRWDR